MKAIYFLLGLITISTALAQEVSKTSLSANSIYLDNDGMVQIREEIKRKKNFLSEYKINFNNDKTGSMKFWENGERFIRVSKDQKNFYYTEGHKSSGEFGESTGSITVTDLDGRLVSKTLCDQNFFLSTHKDGGGNWVGNCAQVTPKICEKVLAAFEGGSKQLQKKQEECSSLSSAMDVAIKETDASENDELSRKLFAEAKADTGLVNKDWTIDYIFTGMPAADKKVKSDIQSYVSRRTLQGKVTTVSAILDACDKLSADGYTGSAKVITPKTDAQTAPVSKQ